MAYRTASTQCMCGVGCTDRLSCESGPHEDGAQEAEVSSETNAGAHEENSACATET